MHKPPRLEELVNIFQAFYNLSIILFLFNCSICLCSIKIFITTFDNFFLVFSVRFFKDRRILVPILWGQDSTKIDLQ